MKLQVIGRTSRQGKGYGLMLIQTDHVCKFFNCIFCKFFNCIFKYKLLTRLLHFKSLEQKLFAMLNGIKYIKCILGRCIGISVLLTQNSAK